MAPQFQLFVLVVAMNFWYGETGQNSTTTSTTGMVSYPSHVPTAEASTQSTTEALTFYACPGYLTERHTCMDKCHDYVWERNLYCHCDPLCVAYGDCCPDYADFCGGEREDDFDDQNAEIYADNKTNTSAIPTIVGSTVTMTTGSAEVTKKEGSMGGVGGSTPDDFTKCVQTIDFDPNGHRPRSGHRLVALCPRDWSGDPGIRNLCQKTAGSDGFSAVPVEGTNGRHYKNVYCALCHGLPSGNVTFWAVSYQENVHGKLRSLNASQMLQIAKGTTPNEAFTKLFNPPGYTNTGTHSPHLEASSLRSCVILDANPCPVSDPDIQNLCDRHMAPIASNGTTYRNLACLRCKNALAHTIPLGEWCDSLNEAQIKGRQPVLSMATLLIFSDHTDIDGLQEGETARSSSSCGDNQIYDPFSDFCRDLVCPDGFGLKDGTRCVRIHANLSTGLMANVQVALTVTGSFQNGYGAQNSHSNEIWEAVAENAAGDYVSSVSVCNNREEDVWNMGQRDQDSNNCDDMNLTWTCSMDVAIFNPAEACLTGSVFTCTVNMSFKSEAPSTDRMINENEGFLRKCFQDNLWNRTTRLDYFTVSTPCGMSNETRGANNESNDGLVSTSSKLAVVWDDYSGRFVVSQNDSCRKVACPLLTLSEDEYVMTGALNDSIRITQDGRVLRRDEFKLKDNGEVDVCNFLQVATPVTAAPTDTLLDYAHSIVTITGSSLSLIGLVVTTATYVAFPTLRRNAAGKSLMCLVASLFFAQLTMLIGFGRTDVITLCVTLAISSHYFWLAAFVWMNILAIDIYRTFGIGTRLNDPNARSFRYYALYGFGAPTLIVCTCAILSFCDCVEVDVHYSSEHSCWIGNGTANLVSFGIPIAVIICSNAVLFSLTVAGVKKTRRESKRMNITQGQGNAAAKKPNTDLILYLKLTAIMGFTWVFGFVASFSGVQFFWYPFIVLNSIQGALVCLAFVCNRRVVAMWKVRVKGSHGRYISDSNGVSTRSLQRSYQTSAESELSPTENGINLNKV